MPNTIGAAAFCDIGTTEGTVAAGNDERFLGTRRVIRRIIQHDTQSPIVLVEKPDGWVVECVQVVVDDLWISTDTNITVGTDSQHDVYFWSGLVDFNVYFRAGWEMSPDVPTSTPETIYAYLTPGTATQGSVRVAVTLVKMEVGG